MENRAVKSEPLSRLQFFHDSAIELERLERLREPALAKRLERARERAGAFPSSSATREVQKLTVEHREMIERIDGLKAIVRTAFRRMAAA